MIRVGYGPALLLFAIVTFVQNYHISGEVERSAISWHRRAPVSLVYSFTVLVVPVRLFGSLSSAIVVPPLSNEIRIQRELVLIRTP